MWVGFFGGWSARRYGPDGVMTDEVRFPVSNITKIALGGPDGRTAYATTARQACRRNNCRAGAGGRHLHLPVRSSPPSPSTARRSEFSLPLPG